MASKPGTKKAKTQKTARPSRAKQPAKRAAGRARPVARLADDGVLGACIFSSGLCEQLTKVDCDLEGGDSWEGGIPCPSSGGGGAALRKAKSLRKPGKPSAQRRTASRRKRQTKS